MSVRIGRSHNMSFQADKDRGSPRPLDTRKIVDLVRCVNAFKKRQRIGNDDASFENDREDLTPRPLRIPKRGIKITPVNALPRQRSARSSPQRFRTADKQVEAIRAAKKFEKNQEIESEASVLGVGIPNMDRGWPSARAPAYMNQSVNLTAHAHAINAGPNSVQSGTHQSNTLATRGLFSRSRALSNPILKEPHYTPGNRTRSVTADVGYPQRSRFLSTRKASVASKDSQSLKQRLFSRMMDGLTISTSTAQISNKGARSRANTSTTIDSDFGNALAAFPSPPTTALTSPTSVDTPTADSYGTKPPFSAVAGVQLQLSPDAIAVSCEGDQNISVAIQIKCEDFPASFADPLSMPRRLDVAVVIDNSLFTSPATLMAQCETTRFLASLLDYHNDRLALFCTRPPRTDTAEPNVVAPLSPWTIRAAKVATDSIVSVAHQPEPAALSMALDSAIDVLAHSNRRTDGERPFGETFGHVFVLSPNANGLSPSLLNHEYLQIHFIEAGILGWRNAAPVLCNGWTLRTSLPDRLPSILGQSESGTDSLFDRLRSLLSFSRMGRVLGQITDLALHIEPGPNSSIERVMGQCHFTSMRPGELITAWASVRVGAISKKSAPNQSDDCRPPTSDDLLKELDVILGSDNEPVLLAKLSYKHSLLSLATSCELSGTASIRRQSAGSQWGGLLSRPTLLQANRTRVRVQKTMIHHLAKHGDPRTALAYLRGRFGETGEHSLCPEYFRLITNELTYQARITERFDLPSQDQNSDSFPAELPSKANHSFEHFDHGLFEVTDFKPQRWLTDAPFEASCDSPPPPPPLKGQESRPRVSDPCGSQSHGSNLSHSSSKDSVDLSNRMWGDIRRLKRPTGISISASESMIVQNPP